MKLIKKPITLPANIEELKKFILIGREKLVSVRAYIRAIDKIGVAKSVREQKQEEANMLAGALLDAEARMGELLKAHVKAGSHEKKIPEGITRKQSEAFQKLSDNKDIIEQVKAEAEVNDDLPTRTEVLKKIREKEYTQRMDKLKNKKIEIPQGSFNIIYSDPPWQYEHPISDSRRIENQYPTMELADIKTYIEDKKIKIAPDAVLLLWTPASIIKQALEVMESWSFIYRSQGVWDKEVSGMGYWFRARHEVLLVGVKGIFSPPPAEDRVDSVYREKRGEHSVKPEFYHSLIEKMYPKGAYLELFGRKKRTNWTVVGNEL